MNIDLEDAACVAYECASRLYKTSQENQWGILSDCRVPKGMEKSHFISSKMMEFLLTDSGCSYTVRVSALKSALNILEGVLSRSKTLSNKPEESENIEFVEACKKELNVTAVCRHAQTIAEQMQQMQNPTIKSSKKLKM